MILDSQTVNNDIDKKLDDVLIELNNIKLDITDINDNLNQFNWLLIVFLIVMIIAMGYVLFLCALLAV